MENNYVIPSALFLLFVLIVFVCWIINPCVLGHRFRDGCDPSGKWKRGKCSRCGVLGK